MKSWVPLLLNAHELIKTRRREASIFFFPSENALNLWGLLIRRLVTKAIDLLSSLAAMLDRRCSECKIGSQVGVILFSIITMLSGAGHWQIHTLIHRRLTS